MANERWRKLEVWQMADDLARLVYRTTRGFPEEERYGITAQLRRAALSIPTNIVEGYSRKGDRELAHFLNIAVGSLAEVKYLLHFANTVGFLEESMYTAADGACDELGGRLWAFYDKVRNART